MIEKALEMLREQQGKCKEHSAPWMVAQQLMDICRAEPDSAALIAQDLENKAMSVTEAERKIKAFADGHRSGNSACVGPEDADRILREFYGLPKRGEASSPGGVALSLSDFLGG